MTFPNAMVDRIVPAPTDETRATAARALGVEDLNGGHSLIEYLGGLDHQETIAASRQQDFIEACARPALVDEYLPSIDLPRDFDVEHYIEQLFARWNNTVLGGKTARVGSDGSTKLLQRVPIPAIRLLEQGRMPEQLALTVAGWRQGGGPRRPHLRYRHLQSRPTRCAASAPQCARSPSRLATRGSTTAPRSSPSGPSSLLLRWRSPSPMRSWAPSSRAASSRSGFNLIKRIEDEEYGGL